MFRGCGSADIVRVPYEKLSVQTLILCAMIALLTLCTNMTTVYTDLVLLSMTQNRLIKGEF